MQGLNRCILHAIWGGAWTPGSWPLSPRCSLPYVDAVSQSSHQALCSPGSVPAVTSQDPPTGLGRAAGVQRACVLICIFTSFPPTPGKFPLLRGWPHVAGVTGASTSRLAPSFLLLGFLLPPSCLITGQGARPLGWETGTEKWKIKTWPDSGSSLSCPWKSLSRWWSQASLPPTFRPQLLLLGSWKILEPQTGYTCGQSRCALHLDELRGRGLKTGPREQGARAMISQC